MAQDNQIKMIQMREEDFNKLMRVCLLIAGRAPLNRNRNVYSARISWSYIIELRNILTDFNMNWKRIYRSLHNIAEDDNE